MVLLNFELIVEARSKKVGHTIFSNKWVEGLALLSVIGVAVVSIFYQFSDTRHVAVQTRIAGIDGSPAPSSGGTKSSMFLKRLAAA